MKVIKMRIGVRPGHPHYEYPPQYDAQKVNHGWGPIYEGGLDTNAELARQRRGHGVGWEEILIGVRDTDAPSFLAADGTTLNVDGVSIPITAVELTREETVLGHKHWMGEPRERITDQKVIDVINIKRAKGEALTEEELKAIDPNDPTPGINLTKSFEETLDEALVSVK